jgi:solute carrier family 35, member E1
MASTITESPSPHLITHRNSPPNNTIAATRTRSQERFPSFDHGARPENPLLPVASPLEISPGHQGPPVAKWPARKSSSQWRQPSHGHRPRKSVSEAINQFRTRTGSVSENAHELAEALKAPISYKLIFLCITWYMTSALTNTSSKSILNAFDKPVTLTIIQFLSVSAWCLIFAWAASVFPFLKHYIPALKNGLRKPSKEVLMTALPLSVFQLLGHLLSSYATSKIPVSLVHTIKGLSPLFTVLAYRVVLRIRYARATYLSLIPLTVGVMLACSTDFSSNFWGIGASLLAAIVFVTQNIFSKKLFTEATRAEADGQHHQSRKLDKLNLLCYCSVGAFLFTAPVWLFTEGFTLIGDFLDDGAVDLEKTLGALDHGALILEFIFNGISHFGQNIMAFVLLSIMSPVSYSVASLIKRVWVIALAVIWFRGSTTPIQAFGIALTCLGLYLYDRTSMEDAAERRTKADHFRHKGGLLPLHEIVEVNTPGLDGKFGSLENSNYEFSDSQFKKNEDQGRPRAGYLGS